MSSSRRRIAPALLAIALAAALPAAAQQPAPTPAAAAAQGEKAEVAPEAVVPLDEIRRFVAVFNTVRGAYVEPIDDKRLMQAAIRGLLLDLDPHSAYLVREQAAAFLEGSDGAYDGIGVEVQPQPDGTILIIAPIDDTPAARAGVKAGDLIIAIDGKTLAPGVEEQNPLRGKPGSSTRLTIVRKGEKAPLELVVKRDTIRVGSVRNRMLEPGYGYIRIAAFQVDTAQEFRRQLGKLQAEAAGGKLKGLVIDLRSNPGGLLASAVEIADDLLEKGIIVSTRGRNQVTEAEFTAQPGDLLAGAPVVVLVDAGSASASEVLAAALRDNGRARIAGSRTFGKGSVQTVQPLDNGDSIKLTTARYYTPSGRSIQALGITPDVVLQPEGARRALVSEAALGGHLQGEQEVEGGQPGDVLEGEAPVKAALGLLKQPAPAVPKAEPPKAASAAPAG